MMLPIVPVGYINFVRLIASVQHQLLGFEMRIASTSAILIWGREMMEMMKADVMDR